MDLAAARSGDAAAVARERARFMRSLQPVLEHDGPKLLVTDSQVYRETVEGRAAGGQPEDATQPRASRPVCCRLRDSAPAVMHVCYHFQALQTAEIFVEQ